MKRTNVTKSLDLFACKLTQRLVVQTIRNFQNSPIHVCYSVWPNFKEGQSVVAVKLISEAEVSQRSSFPFGAQASFGVAFLVQPGGRVRSTGALQKWKYIQVLEGRAVYRLGSAIPTSRASRGFHSSLPVTRMKRPGRVTEAQPAECFQLPTELRSSSMLAFQNPVQVASFFRGAALGTPVPGARRSQGIHSTAWETAVQSQMSSIR